ncbi:MAG: glycosyl transferase [Patescibacteria group bacterium]|nr:MAG: glycosyl transferase [Patescibacteria group bacterium]
MKEKIFIIILNWNRADDTLACLKSLSSLDYFMLDPNVVVVDNGSTDNSIDRISKFEPHNFKLHLIKNNSNFGFAKGNNIGIRYALKNKADYVMILNNDTLVERKLLLNLVSVIKNDKKVGVVSPKIYFAKGFEFHKERYKKEDLGRVIWYAGGEIDWQNVMGINRGVDEVDCGQFDLVEETGFATGCCSLFASYVLEKVGLFDERYFMYFEDVDLSVRIKKAGFKVFYQPDGVVWHKVAQSSGIGSGLNDYFISRNRLLFGFAYASFRTKAALFKESVRLLFKGREWQKKGVVDFYLGKFGKGSWD